MAGLLRRCKKEFLRHIDIGTMEMWACLWFMVQIMTDLKRGDLHSVGGDVLGALGFFLAFAAKLKGSTSRLLLETIEDQIETRRQVLLTLDSELTRLIETQERLFNTITLFEKELERKKDEADVKGAT